MTNKISRKILYKLFNSLWLPQIRPSTEPIDVMIPVLEKDLTILPLCIEGIKKCVNHTIKSTYIIAPQSKEIITFCDDNQLVYIEESTILGITPKDINLLITNDNGITTDRSGWLFQQLIKLSGNIGTCDHFLCIDADHILIKPHTFISVKNIPVFYMSPELHQPYYDNILKITDIKKFSPLSYVAHKMIFNKKTLKQLHQSVREKSSENWIKTIIDYYNRKEGAGFSEFELYGNYIQNKITRPWNQLALDDSSIDSYENLRRKYNKYNCITFPAYLNEK